MKPQLSLTISLASIAALLLMMLAPAETESTTAGWVGYGIIIGLLLSVALRASSTLLYQRIYIQCMNSYLKRSR